MARLYRGCRARAARACPPARVPPARAVRVPRAARRECASDAASPGDWCSRCTQRPVAEPGTSWMAHQVAHIRPSPIPSPARGHGCGMRCAVCDVCRHPSMDSGRLRASNAQHVQARGCGGRTARPCAPPPDHLHRVHESSLPGDHLCIPCKIRVGWALSRLDGAGADAVLAPGASFVAVRRPSVHAMQRRSGARGPPPAHRPAGPPAHRPTDPPAQPAPRASGRRDFLLV